MRILEIKEAVDYLFSTENRDILTIFENKVNVSDAKRVVVVGLVGMNYGDDLCSCGKILSRKREKS